MSSGALPQASNTGTQSLTQEDGWRSGTYAMLGRLLAAAPDRAILRQLASIGADQSDTQDLQGAWSNIARTARETESDPLVEEFSALFIGLGRGELVPYASWYQTGFLMERPLAEVRVALERLGIERQGDVSEPEDHIAVLCETMAILINDADFSLADERAFFNDHLAPWCSRFFTDLECAKTAHFYRSVGRLGKLFMELEQRCLSMSD